MKKLCTDNDGKKYYLDDITGNKLYIDKKFIKESYHDIKKRSGKINDN